MAHLHVDSETNGRTVYEVDKKRIKRKSEGGIKKKLLEGGICIIYLYFSQRGSKFFFRILVGE